ncbi:MAG TPA: DUF1302 family protein [Nevskiaceae bacterium]|nr:DUF1302 family protein [Nevskiaceae bacterium]
MSLGFRVCPRTALGAVLLGAAAPAWSASFSLPFFGEDPLDVVTNTTLIAGVAVRVEDPHPQAIAKNNLNPEVCGRTGSTSLFQACQGLFTDQVFPSQRLAAAPGQYSTNFDHGNLNYERGDLAQSLLRWNQDFSVTWGEWSLFAKFIGIYDPTNYRFDEIRPNLITAENASQVGYVTLPGSVALPVVGARTDSAPCPENRNPLGLPCGIVYGPGGRVVAERNDSRVLREIGLGLQLLDLNLTGFVELPGGYDLQLRIGRQQIIWGEATIQFFDSINVLNPPDLNNFFRVGGNGLDDFYQPVNALSFGITPTDSINLSGWYALEFRPLELPAYGSFYSPVNIGTLDEGPDYVTIGFGNLTPDQDGVGRLIDNPLTLITNTTSRGQRLRDDEPADADGNFGLKFAYTADWLNNGTNIGLYYANYTSRIPMVSVWSTDLSCAKNSTSTAEFLADCPDIPLLHQPLNDPAGATSSALSLEGVSVRLEYPREVEMIGLSFNTSFGDVSVQGEAAYRPNDPLQVDIVDLAFAALGPSLTNCHLAPGCAGSTTGLGTQPDGSTGFYDPSNYETVDGPGAFPDTFDLVVGHLPGSGRSFPNFIIPYRGGTLGMNPANSYIRGWERFQTLSLDFGATYVEGNTDFTARLLGADQVIWLPEIGFRGVLDLPPLDQLALAVPGTYTSPTAGADGSGADGSRQACSSNVACQFGPDGLRFNPHQAPLGLYPTEWSGGIGLVMLVRWESVLPGVSINPTLIFKHDLFGHSPGYFSNYVEGRTLWDTTVEVRYRDDLSLNIGYQMWAGGTDANLFRDRDTVKLFGKYSF